MSLKINLESIQSNLEWIAASRDEDWDRTNVCAIAKIIFTISQYMHTASEEQRERIYSAIRNFVSDHQVIRKCMEAFKIEQKWACFTRISEENLIRIDEAEMALELWRKRENL